MIGYPTLLLSMLHIPLVYPRVLLKCCRATVKEKCARILAACGRLITFAPGLRIHFGQLHTKVRYSMRGNSVSGRRSGLVSGL